MNLVTETKRRLEYLASESEELNRCLNINGISFSAREYLNGEIARTKKNIEYYSKILEVIEK